MRVGIPVADLTAGLFLAQGILVALLERERSGEGQWVTTSLLQAMVNMLDFQATRWLIGGEVPPQAGNDHPTTMPTGVFQCADGQINIAATTPAQWRGLCTTIGAEDLLIGPALRGAGAAIGAASGAARGDRPADGDVRLRAADRGAQRGRRAVGADPGRAGRVREPAGAVAAHHGDGGASVAGGGWRAGSSCGRRATVRRVTAVVGQRRDPARSCATRRTRPRVGRWTSGRRNSVRATAHRAAAGHRDQRRHRQAALRAAILGRER